MRIRLSKTVLVVIFVLNALVLFYMCKTLARIAKEPKSAKVPLAVSSTVIPELENILTVVIRKFEHFENDVLGTVASILAVCPNLQIVVISDITPYPPLNFQSLNYSVDRVRVFSQNLNLLKSFKEHDPLSLIHTKYVLFIPDSTRIVSVRAIHSLIHELQKHPSTVVAATVSGSGSNKCLKINHNIREWFIKYSFAEGDVCDFIQGKHIIIVTSDILMKLPRPFMLPFPDAFYIQTAARNIKAKLLRNEDFSEGKALFRSSHAHWKEQQLYQGRRQEMFQEFGLKKVVRESGVTEWYGCTRESARCFGSVIDDIPQYLWEGKWTPPCCLNGLRRTARHVFEKLDEAGVRYWLEGGSLLGAMRSGDILPWDYDVDVGMYREDIVRCPWLVKAQSRPIIDNEGFVWEKALEGDFFRVQFSQSNHLHVDLFPFYPSNGTMTKDTWFKTHKQDREFPEHFLHPMASIDFVGQQVPAPNNIRDFLELKFGKNSIENPEYPDPSRLKFPQETFAPKSSISN